VKKNYIVENIEKYFLGGLVSGVVWKLDGNQVTINFSTETKDAAGILTFNLPLPEGQVGIYNTDSLLRLLSITNEDLQLELQSDNTGIVKRLKILDNKFDLDYNLSDPNIIEVPKTPLEENYNFNFHFSIDDEFINGFLKAHNALEKIKDFTLNTATTKQDENVVEIILGERTQYSNKVKFTEPCEFTSHSDIIPFSAIAFREILLANKGTEGKVSVDNNGIAKIEFTNDESSVKYFIIRQE
jgi:hypothetical protein